MELSKKEKQTVAVVVMVAVLLTLITVIVFVVSYFYYKDNTNFLFPQAFAQLFSEIIIIFLFGEN